ncbi:MAG: MFS transporter [Treponema sp.]|jgi:MFS family permease|nr:MFS transporter [Treponema sp.]
MKTSLHYGHTRTAAYIAYITQAIVNNLGPLLFLTFRRQFNLSLGSLALLVSLNFAVQLGVDLGAVRFMDRIGYRAAAVGAHLSCTLGLLAMGFLPFVMNPYGGLLIAVTLNAIGGGIAEVIISPLVEALPGTRKAAAMSLLHSFYCWGYVLVVLLSTLYFTLIGIDYWRFLPMLWALLPLGNAFLFAGVPIAVLTSPSKPALPAAALFKKRIFLVLLVVMVCSGASEQAMSQWASLFAEAGLGVSKTLGDLLGPCGFAVLMGLARIFFGLKGGHINPEKALLFSGLLCTASYLIAVFSPHPLLALGGCALCGLSVGLMWPGSLSIASRRFPLGGTPMFALLALAGDLGCGAGPGIVGLVMGGSALKPGILAATVFPLTLSVLFALLYTRSRSRQGAQ